MKNLKFCQVILVSENATELTDWLEKIYCSFQNVSRSDIRKCYFKEEKIKDFRMTVNFESSESKNEIYKIMNGIKANPIKFLKL